VGRRGTCRREQAPNEGGRAFIRAARVSIQNKVKNESEGEKEAEEGGDDDDDQQKVRKGRRQFVLNITARTSVSHILPH
jgi:hypothetical protein